MVVDTGITHILMYFHDFPETPVLGNLKNDVFRKGDVMTPKNQLGIR